MIRSHSGYLGPSQATLNGSATGDVTVTNFAYSPGPLGSFYHSTTSLINVGSRSRELAGLFHFTVRPGPDTTEGTDGPATVDIGFHYVGVDAGSQALDSDHDGLADWYEDRDGDGLTGPEETDPYNPDSNNDGVLDGEEQTALPEVFVASYTCAVSRDFTTVPRVPEPAGAPKLPDVQYYFGWFQGQPHTATNYCDISECLPTPIDPQTFVRGRIDYAWPAVGPGTLKCHLTRQDGTTVTQPSQTNITSPTELSGGLPKEECGTQTVPYEYTMAPPTWGSPFAGRYERRASTRLLLSRTGAFWPKSHRFVVLEGKVYDESAGAVLLTTAGSSGDVTGCTLGEPFHQWQGVEVDPVANRFSLAGREVDADGKVMVRNPKGASDGRWQGYDVTPKSFEEPPSWYHFEVAASPPRIIRMTWSRHPQASASSPQEDFNKGSEALAHDDDKVDRNPTNPTNDDVTEYVEFIVFQGNTPVFTGSYGTGTRYNIILDNLDASALLAAQFANVKVVASIRWLNDDGSYGTPVGISVSGTPAMVILASAYSFVPVHEWGHTVRLEHNHTNEAALMWPEELTGTHREINATERSQIDWSVWANVRWDW